MFLLVVRPVEEVPAFVSHQGLPHDWPLSKMLYNSSWNQVVSQSCEEIQVFKIPLFWQAWWVVKSGREWDSKHTGGSEVPGSPCLSPMAAGSVAGGPWSLLQRQELYLPFCTVTTGPFWGGGKQRSRLPSEFPGPCDDAPLLCLESWYKKCWNSFQLCD